MKFPAIMFSECATVAHKAKTRTFFLKNFSPEHCWGDMTHARLDFFEGV